MVNSTAAKASVSRKGGAQHQPVNLSEAIFSALWEKAASSSLVSSGELARPGVAQSIRFCVSVVPKATTRIEIRPANALVFALVCMATAGLLIGDEDATGPVSQVAGPKAPRPTPAPTSDVSGYQAQLAAEERAGTTAVHANSQPRGPTGEETGMLVLEEPEIEDLSLSGPRKPPEPGAERGSSAPLDTQRVERARGNLAGDLRGALN